MKQQLEGEELLNGLYEVKSLLIAMNNVNKQEQQFKEQIQQETAAQIKSKQRFILIVVVAVLFVFFTLFSGYRSLLYIIIAGAIIFIIRKRRKKSSVGMTNNKLYQANFKKIEQTIAGNQDVQAQIEAFHERKIQISNEYLNNICKWYHQEYGFMEAVEFFIHELELGTATTLPEAIKNFREDQFRKKVLENQQSMINNQKIMINNQEIMISKQDDMIRHQMIGNFIAAATFSEMQNISANTSNIAANTSRTAEYAKDIAQNIKP